MQRKFRELENQASSRNFLLDLTWGNAVLRRPPFCLATYDNCNGFKRFQIKVKPYPGISSSALPRRRSLIQAQFFVRTNEDRKYNQSDTGTNHNPLQRNFICHRSKYRHPDRQKTRVHGTKKAEYSSLHRRFCLFLNQCSRRCLDHGDGDTINNHQCKV